MAIGVLDSPLMKDGFVTPEMERIWSDSATIQSWFDAEKALARVQANLGIIPEAAADAIERAGSLDDEGLQWITARHAAHPFVPALDWLRDRISRVDASARAWVHFGATTQDILDTGRVLQIRNAMDLLDSRIVTVDQLLSGLAQQEADTVMPFRTNGQHAVPGTLGLRIARWIKELRRNRERITQERERVLMAQFSGAAGTYAAYGDANTKIQEGIADLLRITFEPVSWHSSRDSYTALLAQLAVLARSLGKIGDDLFDMQRTELKEAWEAMDAHGSGSTTMPQKRNPFATMVVSECSRLAVGSAITLLMQAPDALERDPRQFEVERDALPRVFAFTDKSLAALIDLAPRLRFDRERMAANARIEGPLIVTEGIMMRLAPVLGHQTAHDMLVDFATEFRQNGTSLVKFVNARSELATALKGIDLDELSQPDWYTGIAGQLARETGAGAPRE